MIADDDSSVRNMLGRLLESEGYDIVYAQTGTEAASKFLTRPYDLALLDLNMPGQDGWEAFQEISRLHPLLPVIIITARPNQYEQARLAGVDVLMEKPLDLPFLLNTMQRLLAQSARDRFKKLSDPCFTTSYLPVKHSFGGNN